MTTLPSDTTSLLVPIHLDAWVVLADNQQVPAWYEAVYSNLTKLDSPIPKAFASSPGKPGKGVHLHWALPDALARGKQEQGDEGGRFLFPYVPNRWLVARLDKPGTVTPGTWTCKLWVIQSDYLDAAEGGSSKFLDPSKETKMEVDPDAGTATITVNQATIGKNYTVESWVGQADPGGDLFLQAVGPGNIYFSAYVPFVKDVFSFIDNDDLPTTGTHKYSYLVVGWYSDPAGADPLRGVTSYVPGIWKDQADWQSQTPAQRFQTLLDDLRWSLPQSEKPPTAPPSTSLYHGLLADVEWDASGPPNPVPQADKVRVVVGNTEVDALATLIQAQARVNAKDETNPAKKHAWLDAGNILAGLIEAAQYDLLDDYNKPGGAVLIDQQIHQAWFGALPGGIAWDVVAIHPQHAGATVEPPALTPQQTTQRNRQLAALNQVQRSYDEALRVLQSLQADLYALWLKFGKAINSDPYNPPPTTPPFKDITAFMENTLKSKTTDGLFCTVWKQYCQAQQLLGQLPDPHDAPAAQTWADKNWTFVKTKPSDPTAPTLSDLGLQLKASNLPRFYHPNDPVLLFTGLGRSQKHGEDGRYNSDGTLTCRLPGQTITGLTVSGKKITPRVGLDPTVQGQNQPVSHYTTVQAGIVNPLPGISNLIVEAFFATPNDTAAMQGASVADIQKAITDLIEQQPGGGGAWIGTPPAPFATALWSQAWTPLFMEWEVTYFPTGKGLDPGRVFALDDWHFDGKEYAWTGAGCNRGYSLKYQGRTFLTPHTQYTFAKRLGDYLKDHSSLDTDDLEKLRKMIGDWDLLAQSLSGFTEQLITLLATETLPPSSPADRTVSCTQGHGGGTPPDVAALIGEQYHAVPVLTGSDETDYKYFWPIRAGFMALTKLQIVDAYGQKFGSQSGDTTGGGSPWINTGSEGFKPLIAEGLAPTTDPKLVHQLNTFPAQLPPRVVQGGRLDFRFLANDASGQDVAVSDDPNPICGWLLPNHLDGGLAVYDGDGKALGELFGPGDWRPRPDDATAPAKPADITNKALGNVLGSINKQSSPVFDDVLLTIDETLWAVDPLGGRKDQMLSVLIGRPLAVVQAELKLRLYGNPAHSRLWNEMLTDSKPYTWKNVIGEIKDIAFSIRLGSLELRHDGLLGYFIGDDFDTFYAVHYPDEISTGDTFIKPITKLDPDNPTWPTGPNKGQPKYDYQGNVTLQFEGDPVTVTMILDPRGSVHAYTGILPVTETALPPRVVEDFVAQLQVTFQTGPIIADPGTLRLPKPAEKHGVWTWIEKVGIGATDWATDTIVDANDRARYPDADVQLREGWLALAEKEEGD